MKARTTRGWTLLELMMAVTIASTLLAIAVSSYGEAQKKVAITQAKVDLNQILHVFERYRVSNASSLPVSLAAIGLDGMRDPWGNPYVYVNFSGMKGKGQMRKDHNLVPINTEFDLYSMGPDGSSQAPLTAKASRDDVIVANDGAFIGVASDY